MSYNVYQVAYLGAPRNHHALFIEMDADGKGRLMHIIGDIQNGMKFEEKEAKRPKESLSFIDKTFLSTIYTSYYQHMLEVCRNNPPSKKQFQRSKRLYPKEPLRRCQEWTLETVDTLIASGILQIGASVASFSTEALYWIWSDEYQ
ncbi:hypothetical protein BGZ63DRAFT_368210 [Mariannaea sp. PMI_226]|nr:hypothetical protein BGZ63DRAFT_368210 [Mariannaea sp. PMI_226]